MYCVSLFMQKHFCKNMPCFNICFSSQRLFWEQTLWISLDTVRSGVQSVWLCKKDEIKNSKYQWSQLDCLTSQSYFFWIASASGPPARDGPCEGKIQAPLWQPANSKSSCFRISERYVRSWRKWKKSGLNLSRKRRACRLLNAKTAWSLLGIKTPKERFVHSLPFQQNQGQNACTPDDSAWLLLKYVFFVVTLQTSVCLPYQELPVSTLIPLSILA